VGSAWRTAGRTGADMGRARGAAGASRHSCSRANLGLAAVSGRGPAAARAWPELGRTGSGSAAAASSRGAGSRVGWVSRAGADVGRSAPGCAAPSAEPAAAATTSSATTRGGTVLECAGRGPRAVVGRPGGCSAISDSDRAVVEPARSGLEPAGLCPRGAGRARIRRLGCTAAGCRRASANRRTFLERPGARLGHAEDRGARGPRRPVVVGAGRVTGRPGCGTPALELAGTARSTCTRSVVAAPAATCPAGCDLP
jgi:hypothetical protein